MAEYALILGGIAIVVILALVSPTVRSTTCSSQREARSTHRSRTDIATTAPFAASPNVDSSDLRDSQSASGLPLFTTIDIGRVVERHDPGGMQLEAA